MEEQFIPILSCAANSRDGLTQNKLDAIRLGPTEKRKLFLMSWGYLKKYRLWVNRNNLFFFAENSKVFNFFLPYLLSYVGIRV